MTDDGYRIPDTGYRIPDEIKIIPNPNDGSFWIELDQSVDEKFLLIVVNTKGVNVIDLKEIKFIGGISFRLSYPELIPGIYILKLKNNTLEYKGKLIIK